MFLSVLQKIDRKVLNLQKTIDKKDSIINVKDSTFREYLKKCMFIDKDQFYIDKYGNVKVKTLIN